MPQLEPLERRDLLTIVMGDPSTVTIDNMQLVNDTGVSDTDRVTTDSTVTATVNGLFSGSHVDIEFDHYADGSVDGTTYTTMPGQQFTYDPSMYDSSISSYAGPFTLRYRSVEYDFQGNVTAMGGWSDFVLTLEQPTNPEIEVVDPWSVTIADGVSSVSFGSTPVGTPEARTFTIYNWGDDPLSIDVSSFSVPGGFTLISPPDSTVSSYGGYTSFSLQLDAVTAGVYVGTVSFGNDDQDESPFDFTVTGEVLSQGPEIELLATGGAVIPDGSGSLDLGDTALGQPKTQSLTIKNWGSSDLTIDTAAISVPIGYSLASLPAATIGGGGGETTFLLQLDASAAGSYTGTVSIPNNDANENPYDFSVAGTVLEAGADPALVYFGLVNDTGSSTTDRVTFDPRVSGKVSGDFLGGTVRVDFDHDGDMTAEGDVIVRLSGESFVYDPRDADPSLEGYTGSLPISYRLSHLDAGGAELSTGNWESFSITMEASPEAGGAVLESFGLYRDTGSSSVDRITVQPEVAAVIGGDIGTGYVRLELDHDADLVTDGYVQTTESGSTVVYDARDTDPSLDGFVGPVNLQYRIAKYDPGDLLITASNWYSFSFTLEEPPLSSWSVINLALANDTGTSDTDRVTYDGTITGEVFGDGAYANITVEFDMDGDGTPDDWALTSEGTTFTYLPDYTQYGETTVYVRAQEWNLAYGTYLATDWSSLQLTLNPQEGIEVLDLALMSDTGESAEDGITSDTWVRGQLSLAGDRTVDHVKVEFDTDGDALVDGIAWTDDYGAFRYHAIGLAAGSVTVAARSAQWDDLLESEVYGQWKSLTFTYEPELPPTVASISLAHDTGASDSDWITSDPTVTGWLTPLGDSGDPTTVGYYAIEFDHNGDQVARAASVRSTGDPG